MSSAHRVRNEKSKRNPLWCRRDCASANREVLVSARVSGIKFDARMIDREATLARHNYSLREKYLVHIAASS
jgi:hypothetical protein